jgi:hypothetical protein
VLLFLSLLQVAREIDNLLFVLPDGGAPERDNAGRVFVIDAVTGLAQLSARRGKLHPLPAPFVIYGAADRAPRGLCQLPPQPVTIADAIVLGATENATKGLPAGSVFARFIGSPQRNERIACFRRLSFLKPGQRAEPCGRSKGFPLISV